MAKRKPEQKGKRARLDDQAGAVMNYLLEQYERLGDPKSAAQIMSESLLLMCAVFRGSVHLREGAPSDQPDLDTDDPFAGARPC